MTSQIKFFIVAFAATALATCLVYWSLNKSTSELMFNQARVAKQQQQRITNTVQNIFTQFDQTTTRLLNNEGLRAAVLSEQYDALLAFDFTNQLIPMQFAIYNAEQRKLYRGSQAAIEGEFYSMESLMLGQIKSSGLRLSVSPFGNELALVKHLGLRDANQLKAVVLIVLPLNQRLIKQIESTTGVDVALTIEQQTITHEQVPPRAADGTIEWPLATTTKGSISYWTDSNAINSDGQLLIWSWVMLVFGLGAAVAIFGFLIIGKQASDIEQVKNHLSEIVNPKELLNQLQVIERSPSNQGLIDPICQLLTNLMSAQRKLEGKVLRHQEECQQEHDIVLSLQTELDSLKTAPRTTSEFLSRMGDEITTPMKTLASMLHLLSEYNLEEEPKELLTIARRASGTLINNLNNILDFSKLDAGMLSLYQKEFDVHQMIEEIAAEFKHHAETKGLLFQHRRSQETPQIVYNDVKRVKQIVRNLVGNAIRFTKQGEVSVYTDLLVEGSRQYLRFTVKDSGVGIPEEAQQSLFDSLETKTKLTNASFAGRLKLIVSKKLSELMGGSIGVTSEPNEGTRIWFTISIDKQ